MYRHRDANSKSAPMLVINSSSEDDGDEDDADLVEYIRQDSLTTILNHRLYLAIVRKELNPAPRDTVHFFNIEETLKYENFFSDFGPLNIAMVYHYCLKVNHLMDDAEMAKKKIFHLTSNDPKKILNAAFLVGCYGIIYLHHNLQSIMKVLAPILKKISGLKYCDASQSELRYLSLKDCLGAIIKAHKLNFFDLTDFNHVAYEYYERVENGDLNWIVPGKFLAFCGPHNETRCESGMVQHSPYLYINYFRQHNVTAVIRLNMRKYDAKSFTAQGFKHYDLIFPDGSNPEEDILQKFLIICEEEKGAIAVHCKAGLGRTGTLIGAYLIKHYGFSAMEAIGWLRICRPGSVIGPQQLWLKRKQPALINEGAVFRRHHPNAANVQHQYGIYSQREECNAAGIVQGISHKVDTMRLNDDDEYLDRMQAANQMNNNTLQLKSVPAARTCQSTKWSLRSSLSRQIAIKGRSAHQSSTSTSRTPANRGRSNPAASATPSGPTIEGEPIPTRMISRRRTSTAVVTQQSSQGDQLNLIKAYRPPRNYNVPDHGGPKINQSCHIRLDQTTATSNAECHGTSSSTDAVSDNAWFNDATKVLFMDCPGKMAVNKTGANNSATSHGRRMSTVEESIFEDPINNHLSNTNLQPNSPDKSNTIVETNDACNNIEYNCNFDVSYHVPSSSSLESLRWSNSDEDDVKGDGSNKCQSVTNNASTKALEPEDPDEINPSSGSATATSPSVGNPCKGIDYDLDVSHNLSSSSSLESYRWKRSEEDGIQDVGFNIGESVASNSMPVLQMAYLTKPTGIYRQMPPPLQPAPRMFYKR
ncbi:dual specificity protein phosphatase CDC14B [Anopheles nili]|uniref:dual specificity protein phosphatase CDC14B n=1 Tax=Anopheles nili TaxID=185578 RepID=UPI00237B969F|nr:dual specificity protein phosphatase CDC14B [Anopheles nili]